MKTIEEINRANVAKISAEKKLPSFLQIASLIALPIALILAGTVVEQSAISGIDPGLTKAERNAQVADILNSMPTTNQVIHFLGHPVICLLYTSPSPRHGLLSRMPSSA